MSQHPVRRIAAATLLAAAPMLVLALPQRPAPDQIPADAGPITIAPVNHASLQLAHGQTVIDVDPVAQANFQGLPAPTLVLVTDIHGDHLDPDTVAKLKGRSTAVAAPAAAAERLPGATVIANGETKTIAGVQVEAVPMYNLTRGPAPGQLYHDKGRGNGYVVTLGGRRIYIAGDTACTLEMRALKNIDVAFVPMNLPYTMTPAEAADCVKAFHPTIVYPYHYRGQDVNAFAKALEGTGVDVRLRDWYQQ